MSGCKGRLTVVLFAPILIILVTGCSGSRTRPDASNPPPTDIPYSTVTQSPTSTQTDLFPTGSEFACIPNHERQAGKVNRVVDGDTIEVEIEGQEYTVRYIGIDTPEAVKPDSPVEYFGPEASERNKELVEGKSVILVQDVSNSDAFGRLLRYVIAENAFVNYELVAQGYAERGSYPPDLACDETFRGGEQAARSGHLGMWAAPTATSTVAATETPKATETLAATPTQPANCDPAYPSVCIPPPPPDLDCSDIPFRRFKVLPPDPHWFDGDHNGVGCERIETPTSPAPAGS